MSRHRLSPGALSIVTCYYGSAFKSHGISVASSRRCFLEALSHKQSGVAIVDGFVRGFCVWAFKCPSCWLHLLGPIACGRPVRSILVAYFPSRKQLPKNHHPLWENAYRRKPSFLLVISMDSTKPLMNRGFRPRPVGRGGCRNGLLASWFGLPWVPPKNVINHYVYHCNKYFRVFQPIVSRA